MHKYFKLLTIKKIITKVIPPPPNPSNYFSVSCRKVKVREMESVNQLTADTKPHCSTAKGEFLEMRNAKTSPGLNFCFKIRHMNIQTLEINLLLNYFSLFLATFRKKIKELNLFIQTNIF